MNVYKINRYEDGGYNGFLMVCADTLDDALTVVRNYDGQSSMRRGLNLTYEPADPPRMDTSRIGVIHDDFS